MHSGDILSNYSPMWAWYQGQPDNVHDPGFCVLHDEIRSERCEPNLWDDKCSSKAYPLCEMI